MKNRKKACSQCGKDLSHLNLDFSRKLICGYCLLSVRKKPHDEVRSETDISAVKKLYDAIKAREIISVTAIRCLEQITGCDFKNTKDFRNKMDQFLEKNYYKGIDLRRARKWTGMEQSELAEWFEVSRYRIMQMETNKKPLSQDALDFIKVMGLKKTVPLFQGKRKVSNKKIMKTKRAKKHTNKKPLQEEERAKYEQQWWEEINPICLKCVRDCKQSNNVEIEACPQFNEKEETVEPNNNYLSTSQDGIL